MDGNEGRETNERERVPQGDIEMYGSIIKRYVRNS